MKRDIDFEAFLAQPRPRPSELERARMQRVLKGAAKVGPQGDSGGHADTVLSELRAMRSEVSSMRDLLIELGQAPANDEVLTRKQAAELLRVCIESITKLVRDEGLPCKRVGKEYRFLRSQVLAWLAPRDDSRLSGED